MELSLSGAEFRKCGSPLLLCYVGFIPYGLWGFIPYGLWGFGSRLNMPTAIFLDSLTSH